MGVKAAVLGASGYGGGEILRLLLRHPAISVTAAAGDSRAGEALAEVHPHLAGATGLRVTAAAEALASGPDLIFSCLPSGALGPLLDRPTGATVIDLSDEHRAAEGWTYGLTEFNRSALASAHSIANPGCYPTAVLLALTPFVGAGIVGGPVVVDAISGVSGAGRKPEDRLLMATLEGSAGAYGSVRHRHIAEMERYLEAFGRRSLTVSFTPHLAPMARGLVATVRAPLESDLDDAGAIDVLRDAYASEPFVDVVGDWPQTKAVAGTNRALVSVRVDRDAGLLIASCSIDNLGKGAAGGAIQNANLVLGLDERTGIDHLGVWP
jgi:N-acetyl-gamma-glutamyl-phosphate reductase